METLPEMIILGHVASSEGKPLTKARGQYPDLVGTLECKYAQEGKLKFTGDGLILITIGEEK